MTDNAQDTPSDGDTSVPSEADRDKRTAVLLAATGLGISALALAIALYALWSNGAAFSSREQTVSSEWDYYAPPENLESLIARVEQSVVEVRCNGTASGFAYDIEPQDTDFSTVIVTNYHVIKDCVDEPGAIEILSLKNSFKSARARIRGFDKVGDLALLETDVQLPRLGSSEHFAERGWWTMAIGNPVDNARERSAILGNATTFGQVSFVLRDFWNYTSATINGGNSGGPLLDNRGDVIGVNTYAAASTEEGVWNIAVDTAQLCVMLIECE